MFFKISRSLLRSSALKAAAALGASGLALAAGNLLLARLLPPSEFALFSLIFSIVMIGISIGPIGADVTLTRRRFEPDSKLHGQIFLTSTVVALFLVVFAAVTYPMRWGLLLCIFVSIVAGALKTVGVAHFRSQQKFGIALLLTTSTNVALLLASIVAFAANAQSALWPGVALSLSLTLTSVLAWHSVSRGARKSGNMEKYAWIEGFAAVSFAGAGMILSAFDRLVIPHFLGLPALATFSVLATIAGSPFHMLHLGIGYTLLPALRNAKNQPLRLQVFKHETLVVGLVGFLAALAVLWLTPSIVEWVLGDRYHIDRALALAAIVAGVLKVAGSLAAAVVNALGAGKHLVQLSIVGGFAIGVSLVGAFIGAKWGLVGLIYGVSAGWLFRAIAISVLAVPQLLRKE